MRYRLIGQNIAKVQGNPFRKNIKLETKLSLDF